MNMSTDARNTPQYSRIRWQNGGMLSRSTLLLADDHVLQITSSGVQERYQRFYFRDIRATMVCDASTGNGIGGVAASFAALFGLLSIVTSGTAALVVMFAICVLVSGCSFWRGRTVKFYVVTELQTVLWRSVARKWQADKLIAQLTPLINAAQSDLVRVAPALAPMPESEVMTGQGGAVVVQAPADAPVNETPQAGQAQRVEQPLQPELPAQPQLPEQPELPKLSNEQPKQSADGGLGAA